MEGIHTREIYQWIENIAFYSVLLVLVMHVLPAGEQKRYVQFFMGLVFMLLIFSPLLRLLGQEEQVTELFQRAAYDQEVEEFLREQKRMEKNLENFTIEMLQEAAEAQSIGEEGGNHTAEWDGWTEGRENREPDGGSNGTENGKPEQQAPGEREGEADRGPAGQDGADGRIVEPVEIRIGED